MLVVDKKTFEEEVLKSDGYTLVDYLEMVVFHVRP